jgi:hypothetical protein
MQPGDISVDSPIWRKSRRSDADCVELAVLDGAIGVRDSKEKVSILAFGRSEWRQFATRIDRGEFDLV